MSTTLLYRLAFSILMLLFVAVSTSISQNASRLSELEGAQSQYDLGSGASMIDGQLSVSNANGAVAYSYPLSVQALDGHQIAGSLNYVSGVATTCYLGYHEVTDTNPDPNVTYNVARWSKFTQNRPAWIFGVGGFAVEVISATGHFHRDPFRVFDSTRTSKYTDADFVWTIDGYDVCNRALNFHHQYARNVFGGDKLVDVIKLLRADGSVLRLQNVQKISWLDQPDQSQFYIGHYYVNEPNSAGYALVDFDSTYWPNHIRRFAATNDRSVVPRIVRYFPGNGLVYIFRERVAPFGLHIFAETDNKYGGMKGSPSIFYLEQIRTESGASIDVYRSRHYSTYRSMFSSDELLDSTKGHALAGGYTGTTLGHDHWPDGNAFHVYYKTQVLGRTFTISVDTIAPGGNGSSLLLPRLDYGYYGDRIPGDLFRSQYQSPMGYVTSILDPMGRRTSFTYERYTTKYHGYGMPGSVDSVELLNYRLTEVQEPDAKYTISYKPNTGVVNAGSTYLPHLISNVADSVKKYGPDGALQTTTRYDITYKSVPGYPTEYSVDSCQIFSADNISGRTAKSTYYYKPYVITDSKLYSEVPRPRFTSLYKVVNTVDTITTISYTQYGDTLAADNVAKWGTPYLILPTAAWTTVNGIRTSFARFSYTTATSRIFGGDTVISNRLGKDIATKTTRIYRPDDTTTLLLRDSTNYLSFPLTFSNVARSDTAWDYLKTRQGMGVEERIDRWYDYALSDAYAQKKITPSGYKWLPPLIGLPTATRLYDGSGRLLGGGRTVYDTVAFSANVRRGKVLSDSAISRDGDRTILGASYSYDKWWGKNVLSRVTNSAGASASVYYDYHLPWLKNGATYVYPSYHVTSNDNVRRTYTLDPNHLLPYLYERPVASVATVRKYGTNGAIYWDTIRTISDLTFFGNTAQVIDPNGNYARIQYDDNGRPTRTNLPFDFSDDSVDYAGTKQLSATCHTVYSTVEDSVFCDDDSWYEWTTATPDYDFCYATAPVFEAKSCYGDGYPDGYPTLLRKKASDVNHVRFTSRAENYAYFNVHFPWDQGYCAGAQSLDSARLRVWISSMHRKPVILAVVIPRLNLRREYVFRVPQVGRFRGGGGAQGKAARSGKEGRSVLLSGEESTPTVIPFDIDLHDFRDSLLTFGPNKSLDFRIHALTADGMVSFVNDADDLVPRLIIKGTFREARRIEGRDKDYSTLVEYNDPQRKVTAKAKLDDQGHSSNLLASGSLSNGARRMQALSLTGVDGRPHQLRGYIGNPASPARIDTAKARFSGDGLMISATSPEHDSVVMEYDAVGRPIRMTNIDGTKTSLRYYFGTPAACGIQDATQDFFGFCSATVGVNETGVKVAQFYDVFGRLRRTIVDSSASGLKLTTKFEYDVLGRNSLVINPRGDSITYWYDDFGRLQYVKHPDFGVGSMAYDDRGNLRFSQTQEQANNRRLTFNEYDDLNRITLVGEASLAAPNNEEPGGGGGGGSRTARRGKGDLRSTLASLPGDPHYYRLTDSLDPNYIHDLGLSLIPTANATIYDPPLIPVPSVWSWASLKEADCALEPDARQGEGSVPPKPFMMHSTQAYEPAVTPYAQATDFEHVAKYPHFIRMAVSYDTLPASFGAIWGAFPSSTRWDSLAPSGRVRNGRGRAVAAAYREHGGEPFHYVVTSYDARGRVEALLRWTENLGFDAVYYSYNSADKVIAVRTADPLRQHTTWYGYDHNGRVDSVWTSLSGVGNGLGVTNPRYPAPDTRPSTPDILYWYTRSSQVDSMKYPPVGLMVDYKYTKRKWIDSLTVYKNGVETFNERLLYDSAGVIVRQSSKDASAPVLHQYYTYDSVGRMVAWFDGTDYTRYTYDQVGNRMTDSFPTGATAYTYNLAADGPDRLSKTETVDGGAITGRRTWSYTADGGVKDAQNRDSTNAILAEEHFDYSWRGLTRRYIDGSPTSPLRDDWRYRSGPGGEREQKRLYASPGGDSLTNVLSWTYYGIGLGNTQMAVYHGQQTVDPMCGDTGRRVYLYPTEYLTYGVGRSANVVSYPNGLKEYKVADHQGSNRLSYTTLGSLANRYDYLPFGEVIAGLAPRQGYIDKEVDGESGLGDYGARKYSQKEGRFQSVDPLWMLDMGTSPYAYGGNSPVVNIDPSGLSQIRVHTTSNGDNPLDPTPHEGGGGGGGASPLDPQNHQGGGIPRSDWRGPGRSGQGGYDGPLGNTPAPRGGMISQSGETYLPNGPIRGGQGAPSMGSDPSQNRIVQGTKGVLGVVGGAGAIAIGLIMIFAAPLSIPVLIGGAVAISLGIVSVGGGTAMIVDASVKPPGARLAAIPGGLGEGIGMAVDNEYGVPWAPLAGSLAETVFTGGYFITTTKNLPLMLQLTELTVWSSMMAGTAFGAADLAYRYQHPSSTAVSVPLVKPTNTYRGTRSVGGFAPIPY